MYELKKYNEKRNFLKTKEPFGKKEVSKKKKRFVVQHHMARSKHYDLRLEVDGVLKSFAVPKGPSYNYKDKRLAVLVEDHPLSYRSFEGIIPKGSYGAGTVMLWDEGYYEGNDIKESFKKGVVKFKLYGKRLKGWWTLVYFKEDNWLLTKEQDGVNVFLDINEYNTSIKTGRTMDEIALNKKKIRNSKKNNIVETINITHPEKIIFSKPKVTKIDVALYYQKVIKRMLPLVKNRILSTIRCPNGIEGECFFKKHLESSIGMGVIKIANEKGKKEDYYYIKDETGIINEVQMNGFEFHVWGSQVSNLNKPDVLVFDLDPDEGISLKKVREGVKDLKKILDELGLVSFLKTSGGKGYHVVVPTKKLKTWKSFSDFAKNIALLMEKKWPDKYTSNIRKENRKNKIFIDWIRNTKSATSVAPYSLRMKKKLRVSMPIAWRDLEKIKPDDITIEKALKMLKRKDPWEDFFKF